MQLCCSTRTPARVALTVMLTKVLLRSTKRSGWMITTPTTLSFGSESISLSMITWLWGNCLCSEEKTTIMCFYLGGINRGTFVAVVAAIRYSVATPSRRDTETPGTEYVIQIIQEQKCHFTPSRKKTPPLNILPFCCFGTPTPNCAPPSSLHQSSACKKKVKKKKKQFVTISPYFFLTIFVGLASRSLRHTDLLFSSNTKMVSDSFQQLRLQRSSFDFGGQI